MSELKRLVYSFIQFLGDQISNSSLSADAVESLEVAIQCLESAYGIQHTATDANLQVSRPLLSIFTDAIKHESKPEEVPINLSHHIPNEEEKQEAERLKNEGNNLMKAEKFMEALDLYSRAIAIDSQNAIYYCNRAAAHSKLNNHKMAIEDCSVAIHLDPSYSKAYGRMGLAYDSLNQPREAKECYEKAVRLEPQNDGYQNNLRVAEEKLKETNIGPSTSAGGGSPFDLGNLLNNPTLMNMATTMMSDPNIRQVMGNLITGSAQQPTGPAPGFDALLQAGQQLAAQMQATNPNLVDMLRQQMQNHLNPSSNNQDNSGNPDPPNN